MVVLFWFHRLYRWRKKGEEFINLEEGNEAFSYKMHQKEMPYNLSSVNWVSCRINSTSYESYKQYLKYVTCDFNWVGGLVKELWIVKHWNWRCRYILALIY